MADVIFKDDTAKVLRACNNAIDAALLEASAEIVSQTARNTRVDTGELKSSWRANVSEVANGYEAVIGSPLENAIWEEFGTGEYALNGDGRKGGWGYEDRKTGETVWTHGKRPSRAFYKAITVTKPKIARYFKETFGIMLK